MSIRRSNLLYKLIRGVGNLCLRAIYRIQIDGRENIPSAGPGILLPKHQYWTDIPLVSFSFAFPLLFVAKKELFRFPGIRAYLSLLGGIPLDRDRSIRTFNAVKYLLSSLTASEKVVLFPEGTYVRGTVGPGKSRLIRMILGIQSELKDKVPFVPVGIRYGERGGWRRSVKIRIGSPLFADGESEAVLLTQRIMEEIGRLSQLPGNCKSEIRNPKHETDSNVPSTKLEIT